MDQKSEHLKVCAKNKNKNLMGITQKIKNMAKKIYWIWPLNLKIGLKNFWEGDK
jgi:hypothetical protein